MKSISRETVYELGNNNNTLVRATIEITSLCNWKCIHCYLPEHNKFGLNKEEIYDLLDDLREWLY